jgi:putative Mg2+ transporter-C (MgtC) family protein
MTDLDLQLELALRLVLAALLGAGIGLEREYHGHPAGMRTHLLVSVGSATFTVLSIAAFPGPGADPARIAAQVVTGIGFLGAGAILKESAGIRGLTTAASLWAVAGVGMAAGAAAWGVAIAATVIILVSLWPLHVIENRLVERHRGRATPPADGGDPGTT